MGPETGGLPRRARGGSADAQAPAAGGCRFPPAERDAALAVGRLFPARAKARVAPPRRAARRAHPARASKARFSPIAAKENPVVDAHGADAAVPAGRRTRTARRALGALFLERAAALAFSSARSSKGKTNQNDKDKGEETFWLCGLFPQFARAARRDRARRARAAEPWSACGGRRSGAGAKTKRTRRGADVVPPAAESEADRIRIRIRIGEGRYHFGRRMALAVHRAPGAAHAAEPAGAHGRRGGVAVPDQPRQRLESRV